MKLAAFAAVLIILLGRPGAEPSGKELLRLCAANYDFTRLTGMRLATTYGTLFFSGTSPATLKAVRNVPLFEDTQTVLVDTTGVRIKEFRDAEVQPMAGGNLLDIPNLFASFKQVEGGKPGVFGSNSCHRVVVGDFQKAWPLFGMLGGKPVRSVKATLWIDQKSHLLRKVEAEVTYRLRDQGSVLVLAIPGNQRKVGPVFIPEEYILAMPGLDSTMSESRRNSLRNMDFREGTPGFKRVQENFRSMDTLTDPKKRTPQERRSQFRDGFMAILGFDHQIARGHAMGEGGFKIKLLEASPFQAPTKGFFKP